MIVPIVFCADRSYGRYLPVAVQSIINHSAARHEYHIIIFDCGIRAEDLAILTQQIARYPHCRLISHNLAAWLKQQNFAARGHWSAAVYGRFQISALCNAYEKVIYADADICFNRDIAELLEANIGAAYLAGVPDICLIERYCAQSREREYFHAVLGLENPLSYVNAGLLVFNIKAWRDYKLDEKCMAFLRARKPAFQDQDSINAICRGHIYHLPHYANCILNVAALPQTPRFDELKSLMADWRQAYNSALSNFHYTGHVKPWHDPTADKAQFWWRAARGTEYYENLLSRAVSNTAGINLDRQAKYYSLFGIPLLLEKITLYKRKYYLFGAKFLHFSTVRHNRKTGARGFYILGIKIFARKPAKT